MFKPPRCPHKDCPCHHSSSGRFYTRHGTYTAKIRPRPIPRFRCRSCERTFSRQTFRHDYRDRKPHLNVRVIQELTSGVGYRQTARIVGLTRRNLLNKARKIQRTAQYLDQNLMQRAADRDRASPSRAPLDIQFDEFESYETRRNTRPLSIAVVVERNSRVILGASAAPIRPRGKMTEGRKAVIAREEARFGPRRNRSAVVCRYTLRRAGKVRPSASVVILGTDEKSTYPSYAAEAFRGRLLVHRQTPSVDPRGYGTPLFPINHTEAMLRDHTGRLRRESWLVSKLRRFLNLHLGLYVAWRNWVRPRFNRDTRCPGEIAGISERRLRPGELVGWRQDWGRRSPCPFRSGKVSVAAAGI